MIVLVLGRREGKAAGEGYRHCPRHDRAVNQTARSLNSESSGDRMFKMYTHAPQTHKILDKTGGWVYMFIIIFSIFFSD